MFISRYINPVGFQAENYNPETRYISIQVKTCQFNISPLSLVKRGQTKIDSNMNFSSCAIFSPWLFLTLKILGSRTWWWG